jgi:DNA-binding IclR family transcriptional regulator
VTEALATKTRKDRPSYNRLVPAVEQAARLLFALAASPRARLPLTEICTKVGIHKSKGYSILNTLMEFGLASKDPVAKTYALGPGLLVLSRAVLDSADPRQVAGPYLRELSAATESTALLGMVTAGEVFVVAKEEPTVGVGVTIRVGHRYPLTWGAHGKAIVAFLPEAERDRVLGEEKVYFYGEPGRTGLDPEALRAELDRVRRDGYATDLGGMQPGIQAVSAPVFGSGPAPIGCVIAVGTSAGGSADAVGERVAAAAREISALMGRTLEAVYRKDGVGGSRFPEGQFPRPLGSASTER